MYNYDEVVTNNKLEKRIYNRPIKVLIGGNIFLLISLVFIYKYWYAVLLALLILNGFILLAPNYVSLELYGDYWIIYDIDSRDIPVNIIKSEEIYKWACKDDDFGTIDILYKRDNEEKVQPIVSANEKQIIRLFDEKLHDIGENNMKIKNMENNFKEGFSFIDDIKNIIKNKFSKK